MSISQPVLFSKNEWFRRYISSEIVMIVKYFFLIPVFILLLILTILLYIPLISFIYSIFLLGFPIILLFLWEYVKMINGQIVPGLYDNGIVIPRDRIFIPYTDIDHICIRKQIVYVSVKKEMDEKYSDVEFRFLRQTVTTSEGISFMESKKIPAKESNLFSTKI